MGIRTGNQADIPFLFVRLQHEMRNLEQFRDIAEPLYYTYAHRIWEHHLTRCIVRVAYPEAYEREGKVISSRPDHILGFIVAEPTSIGLVIHFTYTRADFVHNLNRWRTYRKQGIAKKLLKGMMEDFGLNRAVYTLQGRSNRKQSFREKLNEWSESWLSYNHMLFWSLLPPKWEAGIQATVDPVLNKAFNKAEAEMMLKYD